MKNTIACISLFLLSVFGNAQTLTGPQLLENSIRYHDPNGNWTKERFYFYIRETRPNAGDRITKIRFSKRHEEFYMLQERDGYVVQRVVTDKKCQAKLVKSSPEAVIDSSKINLSCERSKTLRNYYAYLWGLPMKLKDPGAQVHEQVETGEFQGQSCLILKVTYDEAVGKDVWYFYFNETTYALVGYRFYHDETKHDGEYIMLESEEEIGDIRFPKKRSWYSNADGAFLGVDILEKKIK
jgi:hypothetical protein